MNSICRFTLPDGPNGLEEDKPRAPSRWRLNLMCHSISPRKSVFFQSPSTPSLSLLHLPQPPASRAACAALLDMSTIL